VEAYVCVVLPLLSQRQHLQHPPGNTGLSCFVTWTVACGSANRNGPVRAHFDAPQRLDRRLQ